MTDANRTEAQAELRQVIADAFAAKTLWTTDWAAVQLTRFCYLGTPSVSSLYQLYSLAPKPSPTFINLKRKMSVCTFTIYSQC
jgi:hypothetical protein